MDQISIFLHEPGKNIFFIEQDTMPDNFKIDRLKLKRVVTKNISKQQFINVILGKDMWTNSHFTKSIFPP